jgi:hypothetical protein
VKVCRGRGRLFHLPVSLNKGNVVLTFIEFIKYAAIRECETKRARYISLGNKASGKVIKKFYAIMAGRKNRNIRKLSRIGKNPPLTGSQTGRLTVCAVAPDDKLNALTFLPDALMLARKAEFESYNFYFNLANRTREEAKQLLFLWIMHLYKSDLLFCEKLLSRTSTCSARYV